MKAKVKIALNERTQRPSVNAPNYSFYKEGSEIDIVDIVNGDTVDGNNVWYKLDNDAYVWSGGIEGLKMIEVPEIDLTKISPGKKVKCNYSDILLNIPIEWKKIDCSDLKIAIIDTGVFHLHEDIKMNSSNVIDVNGLGINDIVGHGTHVCGLIKAFSNDGITGICPSANVFSINAYHHKVRFVPENVAKGINLAVNTLDCDIINISLSINDENDPILKKEIQDALSRNTILIAAAGENLELIDNVNYPAKIDGIFSIGSVDINYISKLLGEKPQKVDFILPNHNLWSTDILSNNLYKERQGSSMATAIFSGLVASCIKSNNIHRDKDRYLNVKNIMKRVFHDLNDFNFSNLEFYKI